MKQALRFGLFVIGALLFLTACSSADDAEDATAAQPSTSAAPSVAADEPASTTTSTTLLDVVTTIRRVPAAELTSEGTITVGSAEFDFAFECYAAGAGDILALGVGEDPESDAPTQAIVQAFFGRPYVAVFIGDEVHELSVEEPAELFVQGDDIRGSALRFVNVADQPGVGEELGLGTVTVGCESFAPGLPDGYDLS